MTHASLRPSWTCHSPSRSRVVILFHRFLSVPFRRKLGCCHNNGTSFHNGRADYSSIKCPGILPKSDQAWVMGPSWDLTCDLICQSRYLESWARFGQTVPVPCRMEGTLHGCCAAACLEPSNSR